MSAAVLAAGVLCGCARSAPPSVFASPVSLAEVLAVPGVRSSAVRCEFEITAEQGPVAYALLRLDWPEAGRLAFQTDERGRISLRLSEELDASGAVLSAETKPLGQDLLAGSYEESTEPIAGAHITLRLCRD